MKKRYIVMIAGLFVLSLVSGAFAEGVYVTKEGKKYHKEDCSLIKSKDSSQVQLKDAVEKGLTPCQRCMKENLSLEGGKSKKTETAKQK